MKGLPCNTCPSPGSCSATASRPSPRPTNSPAPHRLTKIWFKGKYTLYRYWQDIYIGIVTRHLGQVRWKDENERYSRLKEFHRSAYRYWTETPEALVVLVIVLVWRRLESLSAAVTVIQAFRAAINRVANPGDLSPEIQFLGI